MQLLRLLRAALHRPGRGGELPPAVHELPGLDPRHIARFRAELGFEPDDSMPLSYAYLPVQRAHLDAMLHRDFGHRIVGMVHVGHALHQHAPLDPARPLRLVTHIADEPERDDGARFVRLRTLITQDGQERVACDSRYLARRGRRRGDSPPRDEPETLGPVVASWPLGADAGRRYARLSGDWNPIHLWRWSARLFGLPTVIIHGAHGAARCQAEIERLAGRRVEGLQMEFLRPVPLGSQPTLHLAGSEFELRVDGRGVLRGHCRPGDALAAAAALH
ncbi:MaoC/PaaZ C-terminal domain-containing protein [Roseateles asaccharophilus]|uniref:Acyl dehydratase n=1 Tax=Roseateles asaccharophilus TaxID=582607 RepID=A0ABU2AEK7_9BURK|nr:MaoC/PaaZ C-terminal domain-containing protein [Roseateles asaccharophilus]MDR7335641.1 acyl dehydratase [Roseateles asaccharophilus]